MNVSDLSPDVLDRMEARLLADLDVVRRMRVLIKEDGVRPEVPATAIARPPPAVAAPLPAPVVPVVANTTPVAARKPYNEVLLDCLLEMPQDTFVPQDFRKAVYKATHNYPRPEEVKVFLNRMIRQGKVAVAEKRTGRNGSFYRCLVARSAPAENPAPPPPSTHDSAVSPLPPVEKAAN